MMNETNIASFAVRCEFSSPDENSLAGLQKAVSHLLDSLCIAKSHVLNSDAWWYFA